jgi:hypothetical protein
VHALRFGGAPSRGHTQHATGDVLTSAGCTPATTGSILTAGAPCYNAVRREYIFPQLCPNHDEYQVETSPQTTDVGVISVT